MGGETWIPFGNNLQWPSTNANNPPDDYQLVTTYPSDRHTGYFDKMQEININGANLFRTILFPSSTDIEFEEAGNYFDRLYNAWEVDNMLDEARSLNLYIEMDLQLTYQLANPGPYGLVWWDWQKYFPWCQGLEDNDRPYGYANIVPDPNDPTQFLTDPNAIEKFKWKLQYCAARWGYSRQIALFQIASEINGVGAIVNYSGSNCSWTENDALNIVPYLDQNSPIPAELNAWHYEMLSFMKNDLQVQQLVSESYGGRPVASDHSFDSPDLDVRDFNDYPFGSPNFSQIVINDFHDYNNTNGVRPVMLSETGSAYVPETGGSCPDMEWMRAQWIIPFSGLATGAMNYTRNIPLENTWNVVQDFMQGYDFNNGWSPNISYKADGNLDYEAEAIYMSDASDENFIGSIINRSYNGYVNGCNITAPAPPNNNGTYVQWNDNNSVMTIRASSNWTLYMEEFFDPNDGSLLNWRIRSLDANTNNLEIEFPDLDNVSSGGLRIIPFKIFPFISDQPRMMPSPDSIYSSQVSVYPNPTSTSIQIEAPFQLINVDYRVCSLQGDVILAGKYNDDGSPIDVSLLANGIYFLYIGNDEVLFTGKFCILK